MKFQSLSRSLNRSLKSAGIAAVLGLAAVGAMAQGGPDHGHGRGPGGAGAFGPGMPGAPMMLGGHLLKEVNATEAQRAQIKQIFEAARKDLAAQRDAQRQQHERLEALFTAATIDASAIEAQRAQIAAQHEIGSKRMTQAMIDAAKVLTPEQRVKLAESLKQHREKMAERRKDRKEHREDRKERRGDAPPPPPAR